MENPQGWLPKIQPLYYLSNKHVYFNLKVRWSNLPYFFKSLKMPYIILLAAFLGIGLISYSADVYIKKQGGERPPYIIEERFKDLLKDQASSGALI